MSADTDPNFYRRVFAMVRRIPAGRVMTYGQVATYLGSPRGARAVGYALSYLKDPRVPWHRVVNAAGGVSVGGRVERPADQLRRLRREGIRFDAAERLCLARYRFVPPLPGRAAQSASPASTSAPARPRPRPKRLR